MKDYTDDGGGEIDSDLQYAVYESLQLRGTDPNKFNASLGELFWKYEEGNISSNIICSPFNF